ncbi:asparaginase, partial [bacterium]|nr:asparaginase [bacterium]
MTTEDLKGYRGAAKELLLRENARVWGDVTIATNQGEFKGLILPRSETADDQHIVLKLSTGYNVGLHVSTINKIEEIGYRKAHYKIPEKIFPPDPEKRNVTLLGTGGTIASRLDYRTGAVIPAFSPGELYGAVPELVDICNLKTYKLYGEFSENIGPAHWMGMAQRIAEEITAGADGIVIGHGTDTMHHSAAALTFMVQ